jgi:hypothetical protein
LAVDNKMAEEELQQVIVPEENDPLLPPMKNFVSTFIAHQEAVNKLAPLIFERWETIFAFDNSKNAIFGYLEASLPSPMKENMILIRKFHRVQINNIHTKQIQDVASARANKNKINSLLMKMFISLRKLYGDDIPAFKTAKAPSPEKKSNEPKVESEKKKKPEEEEEEAVEIEEEEAVEIEELKENYLDEGKNEQKYMGMRTEAQAQKLKGQGYHDLYETPYKTILPLLNNVFGNILPEQAKKIIIYEPACGNGAISSVFQGRGFQVIASDLNFGENRSDYLTSEAPEYNVLITNPPFTLGVEFLKKAYESGKPFCLLLPVEYLSRKKSSALFFKHGIEVGLVKKHPFLHDGKHVQVPATAWFVWNPQVSVAGKVRCSNWIPEDIEDDEEI